jgi:hypothetical protein
MSRRLGRRLMPAPLPCAPGGLLLFLAREAAAQPNETFASVSRLTEAGIRRAEPGDWRPAVELTSVIGRFVFGIISVFMMLLAAGLIIYAGVQLVTVFSTPESNIGTQLLDSVGYTIIAVTVFEVAKYIFEEEVLNPTEMRHAGEARRSMTKFISTIAIAVFLEALVAIFQSSKETSLDQMIYPTILLFGGVALIVGLGGYQRLSASAEKLARGAPGEPTKEEDLQRH